MSWKMTDERKKDVIKDLGTEMKYMLVMRQECCSQGRRQGQEGQDQQQQYLQACRGALQGRLTSWRPFVLEVGSRMHHGRVFVMNVLEALQASLKKPVGVNLDSADRCAERTDCFVRVSRRKSVGWRSSQHCEKGISTRRSHGVSLCGSISEKLTDHKHLSETRGGSCNSQVRARNFGWSFHRKRLLHNQMSETVLETRRTTSIFSVSVFFDFFTSSFASVASFLIHLVQTIHTTSFGDHQTDLEDDVLFRNS